MRNFDFSPLYRSTVGFDRLAGLMDAALAGETAQPAYPPYNIEKTGEATYRISVAVAGFRDQDLTVESRDGQLLIAGKREAQGEGERHFLHRGIAERAFERRFQLADHVRPVAARTEHGLLHVDLVREVPEALRPRRIDIVTTPSTPEAKAIEGSAE